MSHVYDVVVIGAGIVGAACASAFAAEGMHVAMVEAGGWAGGATAAGMGHIVVVDDSTAQFSLTQYSQALWKKLAQELPTEAEYRECGTVWVAADRQEMAEVDRKHAYYRDRGIDTGLLDAKELKAVEPYLRSGLAGGLLVPGDAIVYAPAVCRWLLESAVRRGTKAYFERALRVGSGIVLLSGGTELSSPRIVNAAGESADSLTPGIQIRRRKGHLAITDRYPGFVRHELVELGYLKSAHSSTTDSVAFNVQPRTTGQILIGSSRQYDAVHKEVDEEILSAMLRRAFEYMPELATKTIVRTWTGFRAATPDKLPLIGPWLDSTVFLAAGHEGLGITTSLGTARLLADHFAGRKSEIAAEPYLPQRQMNQLTKA